MAQKQFVVISVHHHQRREVIKTPNNVRELYRVVVNYPVFAGEGGKTIHTLKYVQATDELDAWREARAGNFIKEGFDAVRI
jgi:hypothetical protein